MVGLFIVATRKSIDNYRRSEIDTYIERNFEILLIVPPTLGDIYINLIFLSVIGKEVTNLKFRGAFDALNETQGEV